MGPCDALEHVAHLFAHVSLRSRGNAQPVGINLALGDRTGRGRARYATNRPVDVDNLPERGGIASVRTHLSHLTLIE